LGAFFLLSGATDSRFVAGSSSIQEASPHAGQVSTLESHTSLQGWQVFMGFYQAKDALSITEYP